MGSLTMTDEQIAKKFGRRDLPRGAVILNEPSEEGYQCPKGHKMGEITWSEFNEHIWCYVCQVDYPSKDCPMKRPCWETPKQFKEFIGRLPFIPEIIKGVMHFPDCSIPHKKQSPKTLGGKG